MALAIYALMIINKSGGLIYSKVQFLLASCMQGVQRWVPADALAIALPHVEHKHDCPGQEISRSCVIAVHTCNMHAGSGQQEWPHGP